MTKKIMIGIAILLGILIAIWACTKVVVRPKTATRTSQSTSNDSSGSGSSGGGNSGGGDSNEENSGTGGGSSGGDENPIGTDNFTYQYSYGSNYVRYTPIANKFEKINHYSRDEARRMMPMDVHSWSIANFDRSKLIFSHFKLKDANGTVLYEYHDIEGAVHVSLAQNARETNRGNNHQQEYSRFLIAEGNYTIEYHNLSNSVGVAYLEALEQYEGNQFRMLVGSNVTGNLQASVENVDRLQVPPNLDVTVGFTVNFGQYTMVKFNANGFEH